MLKYLIAFFFKGLALFIVFSTQIQVNAQENGPLATKFAEPGTLGEVVKMGENGPTLLLLPCLSCRWRQFDTFMGRNKDNYQMHAITWPGMGGTPVPDFPYMEDQTIWLDNAIDAVVNYIDENNLTDVYVLGASLGGSMDMYIANARPDAIKGIISLDATLFIPYDMLSKDRLKAANEMRQSMIEPLRYDQDAWEKFNTPTMDDPERKRQYYGWFLSTPRNVMNAYYFEIVMTFPRRNQQLESLKVPLLDIRAIRPWWKDKDARRQKVEDWMDQADRPEDYQLVFMYGSGHHMLEYQPEALDNMVAAFIAGETVEDFKPETEIGND